MAYAEGQVNLPPRWTTFHTLLLIIIIFSHGQITIQVDSLIKLTANKLTTNSHKPIDSSMGSNKTQIRKLIHANFQTKTLNIYII